MVEVQNWQSNFGEQLRNKSKGEGKQGTVVHTCNRSYSGNLSRRIVVQVSLYINMRPYSKKYLKLGYDSSHMPALANPSSTKIKK
jgi:hypothetical protein